MPPSDVVLNVRESYNLLKDYEVSNLHKAHPCGRSQDPSHTSRSSTRPPASPGRGSTQTGHPD